MHLVNTTCQTSMLPQYQRLQSERQGCARPSIRTQASKASTKQGKHGARGCCRHSPPPAVQLRHAKPQSQACSAPGSEPSDSMHDHECSSQPQRTTHSSSPQAWSSLISASQSSKPSSARKHSYSSLQPRWAQVVLLACLAAQHACSRVESLSVQGHRATCKGFNQVCLLRLELKSAKLFYKLAFPVNMSPLPNAQQAPSLPAAHSGPEPPCSFSRLAGGVSALAESFSHPEP